MIKKTSISIIVFLALMAASAITASAETVTHNDSTDDVVNSDFEEVSRPNLDIEKLTAVKDGKQVELKLKLAEGGTILFIEYGLGGDTTDLPFTIIDPFINLSKDKSKDECK